MSSRLATCTETHAIGYGFIRRTGLFSQKKLFHRHCGYPQLKSQFQSRESKLELEKSKNKSERKKMVRKKDKIPNEIINVKTRRTKNDPKLTALTESSRCPLPPLPSIDSSTALTSDHFLLLLAYDLRRWLLSAVLLLPHILFLLFSPI